MSAILWEYANGDKLVNVTGRGIILALMNNSDAHHVGDRWVFHFSDHESIVLVKGVEMTSASTKLVGLCFSAQFDQDEIQEMKSSAIVATKISDEAIRDRLIHQMHDAGYSEFRIQYIYGFGGTLKVDEAIRDEMDCPALWTIVKLLKIDKQNGGCGDTFSHQINSEFAKRFQGVYKLNK